MHDTTIQPQPDTTLEAVKREANKAGRPCLAVRAHGRTDYMPIDQFMPHMGIIVGIAYPDRWQYRSKNRAGH